MEPDPQVLALLTVIGSLGVAWGVSKARSASQEEKIARIDKTLNQHVIDDHHIQLETVDRLARIETKLDRALKEGSEK